jgi:transcriptional regulator with XRE-family HTH domain
MEELKWWIMLLFSGMGTWFIKEWRDSKKNRPVVARDSRPSEEQKPLSESQLTALRLKRAVELMNATIGYTFITIPKIAELLSLPRVSQFENVVMGKEEASIDLLERFSSFFGVNYDWLLEGKGEPFNNSLRGIHDPFDLMDWLQNNSYEQIFFVRSKSSFSEYGIVIKLNDYKYVTVDRWWALGAHKGVGAYQVYSLYQLICELKLNKGRCSSFDFEEELFWQLLNGKHYPGTYLSPMKSNSFWWDDFTDISHHYPCASGYLEGYGTSFISGQKVVRDFITHKGYKEYSVHELAWGVAV